MCKYYKGDIVKINIQALKKTGYYSDISVFKKLGITGRKRGLIESANSVRTTVLVAFPLSDGNQVAYVESPIDYIKLVKSAPRHPLTKIFV
jgi:hypothetical protein